MLLPYLPAVTAFFLAAALTPVIKRLSVRLSVVDRPNDEAKKLHRQSIPLLGGTAIFISIALVLAGLFFLDDPTLTSGLIGYQQYIGFLFGGLILMVGGFFDDKFTLSPKVTIFFPILAALTAVIFGIGVSKVSNPFGGAIEISTIVSQLVTFIWLLVVMYVTKFLDGLDGLATGVSAIGALMMTGLALTVMYFQPDAAAFAAICAGALLGFLVWNWHPAKIFLGEGGSTFVGFIIGVLAVIGGAKVGTALLVLSIPFLDVIWVVLRRTLIEHRSPTKGDRKHLHHRLLDLGLSQRQVVLIYYAIAALVGVSTLFLQSKQKLILFVAIVLLMIVGATLLVLTERKRRL
ncbi:MAG: MraY family glycosyltransferase [Patescibacteria group bacterium]